MILGPKRLLKLVKSIRLVENLSERELKNPEGAGFDLRLGEIYKISGKAYLEQEHRRTADIKLLEKYNSGKKKNIKIKPGEFFLVKTIESVNVPQDLVGINTTRSTLYRSGIFLQTANIPSGYRGQLVFGLKNEGPITVEIEMGARISHVQFAKVLGGGNMYRGQWQGGRVSASKKEKQV